MVYKSVYRYFRPLMVCCYLMGQFPARNVFTESSDHLQCSYITVPFLLSLFLNAATFIGVLCDGIVSSKINLIPNVIMYASIFSLKCLLLSKSSDLVVLFKFTDKMRETLLKQVSYLRPKQTKPKIYSLLLFLIFFAVIISVVYFTTTIVQNWYVRCFWSFHTVFVNHSPLRHCLVLCSLYYSVSLVVKDTIQSWRLYCSVNCRSRQHIKDFCQMIMAQGQILRDMETLLGKHVLLLKLNFIAKFISDILFTDMNFARKLNLFDLLHWGSFLTILAFGMRSTSIQFNSLRKEVLCMFTSDVTKKDAVMIRVLLAQLQSDAGRFTAAGYASLKPAILFFICALGLDYYVLFEQNVPQLRQLFGVAAPADYVTSPNYTMMNQ